MVRARELRDNTRVSSDKAMAIFEDMKNRTAEAIEKSKVVATEIGTLANQTFQRVDGINEIV